jgi:hypothetical protein
MFHLLINPGCPYSQVGAAFSKLEADLAAALGAAATAAAVLEDGSEGAASAAAAAAARAEGGSPLLLRQFIMLSDALLSGRLASPEPFLPLKAPNSPSTPEKSAHVKSKCGRVYAPAAGRHGSFGRCPGVARGATTAGGVLARRV